MVDNTVPAGPTIGQTWKFGIEVELTAPRNSDLVQASSGSHNYGNALPNMPRGWQAKRDGSLHTTRSGYGTAEIVSPPMTGESGLAEVYYMIDDAREASAATNASCGLHVHIDAARLDGHGAAMVKAFTRYELAFYALCGRDAATRYANSYCAPVARSTPDRRYRALNVTNVGSAHKNTYEFRLFASRLDADYIAAAVHMAIALGVYASKHEADEIGPRITDISTAVESFVLEVLTDRDGYIVPEEPIDDVVSFLASAARDARQAFAQRAARGY